MFDMKPKMDFFGKKFNIELYTRDDKVRVRINRVRIVKPDNTAPFEIESQIFDPDLDHEWADSVQCLQWVRNWLQENYYKF